LPVAFKDDTDHVIEIMRKVAEDLRAEPKYGAVMIEPIEVFGVDAFTDLGVTINARFKTNPSQQHTVGREYRRRLKKAFEAAGMEFPTQRRPSLA
jgi:small conductance mechanosensitive channel